MTVCELGMLDLYPTHSDINPLFNGSADGLCLLLKSHIITIIVAPSSVMDGYVSVYNIQMAKLF